MPYRLDTAPSQRFRLEQWAPYLAEDGIDLEFEPFANEALASALYSSDAPIRKVLEVLRCTARRFASLRKARAVDLVVVHREGLPLGPAAYERLTRILGRRYVFDFDDAVWLPNVSESNRLFAALKLPGKTRTSCSLASAVIAGNPYLAEYASRYCPSVEVIPTTVPLRSYQPGRPREPEIPTVGWSGSHSSATYLREIREALASLRRRVPYRLLVIGASGVEVPGVEVECRPWRSETEVADLRAIDIGIMPLRDDEWARGKCALKAIQYMALAIPTVVSPVGANREVVQHDANGLHAEGLGGWVGALERLIREPSTRSRLGQAGRRTVEERYSAEVQAPRVARILREAAGAAPRSASQ